MKGLLNSVPFLSWKKTLCSEQSEDPGSMKYNTNHGRYFTSKDWGENKERYIVQERLHEEVRDLNSSYPFARNSGIMALPSPDKLGLLSSNKLFYVVFQEHFKEDGKVASSIRVVPGCKEKGTTLRAKITCKKSVAQELKHLAEDKTFWALHDNSLN